MTDLGVSESLSYAVGTASGRPSFMRISLHARLIFSTGDVNTAKLQFGNYTVDNQAFRA